MPADPILLTAAAVAFLHTVLGPDHYLPFAAMARSGGWSVKRTATLTLLCGVGHIGGSLLLASLGAWAGLAATKLAVLDGIRSELAAWLLIAFGLLYAARGLKRALERTPHSHLHVHDDGTVHRHPHQHHGPHRHAHSADDLPAKRRLTPWLLFVVFLLGPCEPLLPLVLYPAATSGLGTLGLVVLVFSAVTLGTMLLCVGLLVRGFDLLPIARWDRFGDVAAGTAVLSCGLAIRFLGL